MPVQNQTTIGVGLPDRFVSRSQAAEFLGLSVSTLASWATLGHGPAFSKLSAGRSGCVRYSLAELQRFVGDPQAYRPRLVAKFTKPQTRGGQPNVSIARARRRRHGKAKA
jgi:hypothetical protein